MIQQLINHVGLVLDRSYSMTRHERKVVQAARDQVKFLAKLSTDADQETRVSIYTFDDFVECMVFDKDVLRLPSIEGLYKIGHNTALIDGTMQAITDLEKTAQMYGDHAFLLFVLTDGMENASRLFKKQMLMDKFARLPENWTVAIFVPNAYGKLVAQEYGFAPDNIALWDTETTQGFERAANVIQNTTQSFVQARAAGIRGSKSVFTLNAQNLSATVLATNLQALGSGLYDVLNVPSGRPEIASFVSFATGKPYVIGSAFYQIVKPETVQSHKQVAIMDRRTSMVYTGPQARQLIGLPDHEVRVHPDRFSDYLIFIQSTSTNRKLDTGTKLLVMK